LISPLVSWIGIQNLNQNKIRQERASTLFSECACARRVDAPGRALTIPSSTERWNDVLGEQFDLAHLLVR
jgi:hypothetical protein